MAPGNIGVQFCWEHELVYGLPAVKNQLDLLLSLGAGNQQATSPTSLCKGFASWEASYQPMLDFATGGESCVADMIFMGLVTTSLVTCITSA